MLDSKSPLVPESLPKTFYWALGLSFLFFPYFFLGLKTPLMSPYSWALKESVVGYMVFLPGLRSLQWQVFENGQWLWNSLRSMGLPLMANEVQVGPLYPLTLLFSWLPDSLFWFFFVSTKVVLLTWASLLIGQRVFRLTFPATLVFAVSLSFALYVTRFMNHPWHNAFVAFCWYFLAVFEVLNRERKHLQFWPLALVLSFYALLTSGFPSATAIFSLLTFLFYGVFVVSDSRGQATFYLRRSFLVALLHLPALLLSAPMVFALLELISLTTGDFRARFGVYQIKTPGVFLGMVHRFWNGNPPYEIVHVIRLIPLFLMGWGVCELYQIRKHWRPYQWGVFALFVFGALKYFPVFPQFNELIGSLPVLKNTHFTIYGFAFFLIPFAYWTAVGAENLLRLDIKPRWRLVGVFLFVLLSFFGAVVYAVVEGAEINPLRCILVLPFVLGLLFLLSKRNTVISPRFRVLFFALLLAEALWTQPSSFLSVKSAFYTEKMEGSVHGVALAQVLPEDFRRQFRLVEGNGLYSKWGFSTADVGATAILPERYRRLRATLFQVPWRGYMPIDSPRFSYSHSLLASSVYFTQDQAFPSLKLEKLEVPSSKPVWMDPQSLSRLSRAKRCVVVRDQDAAFEYLATPSKFELGDVVLEEENLPSGLDCDHFRDQGQNLQIIQDTGSHWLGQPIEGPALLHLSELYYPGWKAQDTMSGDSLQLVPANGALSAIYLPEKRLYQLRMSYEPDWLVRSKRCVYAGLLLLLSILIGPLAERLLVRRRTKISH